MLAFRQKIFFKKNKWNYDVFQNFIKNGQNGILEDNGQMNQFQVQYRFGTTYQSIMFQDAFWL